MMVLAPTITASLEALNWWSLFRSWGQLSWLKPVLLASLPSTIIVEYTTTYGTGFETLIKDL
jgi:hypothetical protein